MDKTSFVIVVILLGAVVSVNSLQCYSCENCASGTLKEEQLKSCGATITTTTTTTATPPVNPPEGSNNTATGNSTNTENPNNSTDTSNNSTFSAARDLFEDVAFGCSCSGAEGCDCDGVRSLQISDYADNATDTKYVCAKATMKINATDVVVRDCVSSKVGDKDFCSWAANMNFTGCTTCETDKCNSAFSVHNSLVILLLGVSLTLFK